MNTQPNPAYMVFGTTEPVPPVRRISAGPLSVDFVDGAVRALCWRGVEVIRAIDSPIRDESWSTCPFKAVNEVSAGADAFELVSQRTVADGALSCRLLFSGRADGRFLARVELTAHKNFRTNRSGFVVLHPLDGVAGSSLIVLSQAGSSVATVFPAPISPGQVAFKIAGLDYNVRGIKTSIRFKGEVFEMEDQRNWSDASFKTYCRPLSLPIPYELAAGETVKQEIEVRLEDDKPRIVQAAAVAAKNELKLATTAEYSPGIALALDSSSLPDSQRCRVARIASPNILQLRVTAKDAMEVFASARELSGDDAPQIELEIVVAEGRELDSCLADVAECCKHFSLRCSRVIALPELYLKSYQPTGRWPEGPTPRDAAIAARKHFPKSSIGSGCLTNFTELNRHRPDMGVSDYLAHGSTAIIHAADDRSVIETLEGLSHIYASARALAGSKEYRLGLVSIGMRTNPYGADVTPNPEQLRLTMSRIDPRQRGLFAAAWTVGVVAATAGHGVSSLALAAPVGPLGIAYKAASWPQPLYDGLAGAAVYPLFHTVRAFSQMANAPRLSVQSGIAGIVGVGAAGKESTRLVLANLAPESGAVRLPRAARIRRLDRGSFAAAITQPDWLHTAEPQFRDQVSLESFDIAFIEMAGTA